MARLKCQIRKNTLAFTLIEVLIALAIISIGLSALIKATLANTRLTNMIKNKVVSHMVAFEGITLIQLGLLDPLGSSTITEKTKMINNNWYWRPTIHSTPIDSISLIEIKVSTKTTGPYTNSLFAFWYHPNE
ncbi:MAG: type II secretion system protein GspI [Legionellales bacterium RIFCSPHIGHO2_12_FULL_37_14]|nr:MAG: type II secretion system protein GspI [Legionellales bacterium RIFCSPHIGHO2_12_FULL_37_14]